MEMARVVAEADEGALQEQAVRWLMRVQSDHAAPEDYMALADWLELSPVHRAVFDKLENNWAALSNLPADIETQLARPRLAQVIELRPERRANLFRFGLGIGVAASIAAVLVLGPMAWRGAFGTPVVYRTAKGQTRVVTLSDGTRITLDAASEVTARVGWLRRSVELGQAGAVFDVAKDRSRPFVIAVGDQQVRVVGTEFDIHHFDQQVVVTVRRGLVDVIQPNLGEAPIWRLSPGQQSRHVEGQAQSRKVNVDPQIAFAWTNGRIICRDMPLSELVAELNRRYPVPIVVDRLVQERQFSGVLELGDQSELVHRLAAFLDLSAQRQQGRIVLR